MTNLECPQVQTGTWRPFRSPSLGFRLKPIFALGQKFDKSNPYMECGSHRLLND